MNNAIDYEGIAVSIFDAMNTNEFSVFERNAASDISFDFPGTNRIEGVKRIILFFKVLLKKYKELTFWVNEVIIADEKACVVWTNKGTYQDGTNYENRGITLFHFKGDKVTFISDYFKDTSFTIID